MSVPPVTNTPPYGSEGPYDALRLADALALRDPHLEAFLRGDAVGVLAGRHSRAARAVPDLAEATVRCDRAPSF